MKPKTAYAQSGDVYIAHQVFGRGDVDLVVTASSNIDYGWEQPELASYLRALGSFARVILFDRRGTGLSDRTATVATIEERMDDIRAVMDAAESNRAALYAPWGLAAASVFFAATHPERVRALILWMPQIRRTWAPDYPWRTPQSGTQHPGATWGSDLDARMLGAYCRRSPRRLSCCIAAPTLLWREAHMSRTESRVGCFSTSGRETVRRGQAIRRRFSLQFAISSPRRPMWRSRTRRARARSWRRSSSRTSSIRRGAPRNWATHGGAIFCSATTRVCAGSSFGFGDASSILPEMVSLRCSTVQLERSDALARSWTPDRN